MVNLVFSNHKTDFQQEQKKPRTESFTDFN